MAAGRSFGILIGIFCSLNIIQSVFNISDQILGILDASADPKHQKMYVNSLTAEQKLREAAYNEVLAHVEDVINTRYSSLVS